MLTGLFGKKNYVQPNDNIVRLKPINNAQRVIGLLSLIMLPESDFRMRMETFRLATKKSSLIPIAQIIDAVFLSFQFDSRYLKIYLNFIDRKVEQQITSPTPVNLDFDEDDFLPEEISEKDFAFIRKAILYGKNKTLESISSELNYGYSYTYEYFVRYFIEKKCTPIDINFNRLFEETMSDKSLAGLRFGHSPQEMKVTVTEIHKLMSQAKSSLIGYDIAIFLENMMEANRINLLNENNMFEYAGQVIPYVRKYFKSWNDYSESYLMGKTYADEVTAEELSRIKEITKEVVRPIGAENLESFLDQK